MAAAYDLVNTWAEEARLRTEQPTRGCDDDAATPTSCAPVRTDHVAVLVVEGRAESQVVLVDEEPGGNGCCATRAACHRRVSPSDATMRSHAGLVAAAAALLLMSGCGDAAPGGASSATTDPVSGCPSTSPAACATPSHCSLGPSVRWTTGVSSSRPARDGTVTGSSTSWPARSRRRTEARFEPPPNRVKAWH